MVQSLTLLHQAKHCFLQIAVQLSPFIRLRIRYLNFHQAVHLQNPVLVMVFPRPIFHWRLQTLACLRYSTQLAPSLTLRGKDPNSLPKDEFTNHY